LMAGRKELVSKVKAVLADAGFSEKMWSSMTRARENRRRAIEQYGIDVHRMKLENREVKLRSAADGGLVERFAEQARRNGAEVVLARTGAEVIDYVEKVARRVNADVMIKAKSLTTEEIDFNHELEKREIRCVETDLGELIVQLAGERPIHLVAPAAHKSVEDIAEIVNRELNLHVPPEHEAILRGVRDYLRPVFLSAKVGVTGGNIGVADTGTVIIETNEGNGRLVSSVPDTQIVVIGKEKIVASWDEVSGLVAGHAISASGQRMTVYVSAMTQRLPLAGRSEGREMHVIILDNGRSRMAEDPWYSDALNCIRCGACMNACPTYGIVGGHVFGYIYPGPIGIPWTAAVHGVDKATFSHLCVSCGLCKEICPIDIDIPMMIAKVKQEEVEMKGQMRANWFFASSETLARVASFSAPLSNWALKTSVSRYALEKAFGVDRRRSLPSFSRRRLRSLLNGEPDGDGSAGRVVFFPDIYADYNDPKLGATAVRLLRSLGYSVALPDLKWSGMPYISYGELGKATRVAEYNLRILRPFLGEGYQVVSTEPTAVYMLRGPYRKLVPGKDSESASARSFSFFEFIERRMEGLRLRPTFDTNWQVGFHIPCHDRGLTGGRPAIRFLEKAGYRVSVVETGTCCGMGGTFGMKSGPVGFELSMAVGEELFRLFRENGCRIAATESSVCSTQINDGTGIGVLHPLNMVSLD
jgi:L-lactate dehydrogenase complex protein LldF